MDTPTHNRWQPVAILGLVVLSLVLFWLLVADRADRSLHRVEATTTTEQVQRKFEWKLVTTWPKNLPGLSSHAANFSRLVDEMSQGRLTVKVYGAGELVPALGVFDAVSSGSVEVGHGAAYYWKGKMPAAQFFTSVPFGLNAQEMNGWLHYGGGLELWRDLYEPFNLVPFAGGNTGVQMAGWFNKEINSAEDLKGLKMRIPGLGGEVLNRAGGSSINIPGGELYTALQTGVIDATEWVGPYNDLAFGFYQIAKYYYYPGWHEPGPTLEMIVNKDAFEALPEDLKVIVETASRAANQDMLDEFTGRNNDALRELVDNHGVQVRRLPDDVLLKLKGIAEDIYREQAAKDEDFNRVYKAYRKFSDGVRQYHKLSDQAYFEARDLEPAQ